jgi:hypothetical protein
MAELTDELLQRFIAQQDEVIAGYQGLRSVVDGMKLHQRRLRGEVRAARVEISALSGTLERMKGDAIVLNATIESLEEWAQRVDQKLDGVHELAKSTYNMSESVLKRLPFLSKFQDVSAGVRQSSIPSKDG